MRPTARRWASVTLGLALLGLLLPHQAHAFCRLSTGMPMPGPVGGCNVSGVPLTWDSQCLTYSVVGRERDTPAFDDEDAFDIRDAIDSSFATWAEVECGGGQLPVEVRQTVPLSKCDDPEHNSDGLNSNSIAFVENWEDRGLPPEAYGVTLVWHDPNSGEIVDADMQLNETAGTIDFCESSCSGDGVDLQNVVTHEVGHFLGLGHSDEVNASMYGESTRGEIRKAFLNDDDVEGICSIYAGLEEPGCKSADFAPRNGWSPACGAGEDGCSVGRVGRHSDRSSIPFALFLLAILGGAYRRRARC